MKKIMLLVAISVAASMSAKNSVNLAKEVPGAFKQEENKSEALRAICTTVTYDGFCSGSQWLDTICWEDGNPRSIRDAIICYENQYNLIQEMDCNGGL